MKNRSKKLAKQNAPRDNRELQEGLVLVILGIEWESKSIASQGMNCGSATEPRVFFQMVDTFVSQAPYVKVLGKGNAKGCQSFRADRLAQKYRSSFGRDVHRSRAEGLQILEF